VTYLPIVAIALAVIGPVTLYLGLIVSMREDIATLMSDRETFWRILGPPLANIIHSPEHVRRDTLTDGLRDRTLSLEELLELKPLLEEQIAQAQEEKNFYDQFAGAMLLVLAEQQISDYQRRRKKI